MDLGVAVEMRPHGLDNDQDKRTQRRWVCVLSGEPIGDRSPIRLREFGWPPAVSLILPNQFLARSYVSCDA